MCLGNRPPPLPPSLPPLHFFTRPLPLPLSPPPPLQVRAALHHHLMLEFALTMLHSAVRRGPLSNRCVCVCGGGGEEGKKEEGEDAAQCGAARAALQQVQGGVGAGEGGRGGMKPPTILSCPSLLQQTVALVGPWLLFMSSSLSAPHPRRSDRTLAFLDPLLPLMARSLKARHQGVVTAALRCLALVVPLPLPGLPSACASKHGGKQGWRA